MAFSVAGIKIEISADATKAAAALGRAGDAAGKSGDAAEKSTSKWKTFAKTAALAAGSAALGGLVAMFKTGIGEQSDYLAGQAQLANGIKTTGNAAHVSVKGLEDLASSIQGYSGQTDDSIVASEKLLLTFTNVRNEAGKNNDIFTQATKITADMAAKMGGDASKYAVQLGKALNDPTKGLTALTKIGVSFTEQQKKSIKSMQASGNTLGAQKIIMGELRKEFGGSAKAAGDTLPGQMAKAKRSFEDVSQGLVASLMPALTLLANILTGTLLPAFQATIGWMTSHKGAVLAFAVAIGSVYAAIKVGQGLTALDQAGGLMAWIKQTSLAANATRVWAGIQAVFNAIMALNPVVLIVAAVIALGIAVVIAYKKSETFRKIVQSAFKAVAAGARALWKAIQVAFKAIVAIVKIGARILYYWYIWPYKMAFKIIVAVIKAIVKWLPSAWRSIVSGVKSGLSTVWTVITKPFKSAWDWVKKNVIDKLRSGFSNMASSVGRALSGVWTAIVSPFKSAWTWVKSNVIDKLRSGLNNMAASVARALSGTWSAIVSPFKSAWTWIKTNVIDKLRSGFANMSGSVGRALSGVWSAIVSPFKTAWDWIKQHVVSPLRSAFTGAADAMTRALHGVTDAITAPFKAAWDWIKRNVIDKITSGFKAVGSTLKNAINSVIRGWNNLSFTIGGWKLPFPPHTKFPSVTINTPNLPYLAAGGLVSRPTVAVVGEGGPEIVAPVAMLRKIMSEGGTTIVVNGALDPDAVARQIESLLARRNRRVNGPARRGTSTLAAIST